MKMNRKSGFTLVEIMIVVAIIALLAVIAIPSFMRARLKSQQSACVNNLRQISGASDSYALDHSGTWPTAISDLVGGTMYITKTPKCPSGGAYTLGASTGTSPTCAGGNYDTVNFPHQLPTS